MSSIAVIDILSVACAAYRINGNQILRESKDDKIANSVLVKAHFWDNKHLDVTDEDRAKAEEVKNYICQQVTMMMLTGTTINDFLNSVFAIVNTEKTHLRNIGVVTWAPKLCADLARTDEQKHEMTVLSYGSNYLGKDGDKIELTFTTIVERWTQAYNCYRYTGHDGQGNLVGFLSKNKLSNLTGVKIKGRIKTTEKGRFTGGKTTYLNYVKEIK